MEEDTMEKKFDIIILGGGPAGMAAAIYAGRAALNAVIIDAGVTGGQLNKILEIENYPGFPIVGGYDLAEKFEEHADKFNIEKYIMQEITAIDLNSPVKTIQTTEHTFKANAVIIATGAQPQKLGVPGEDAFLGKGVSYCAVCDGAFFRDKEICVVGGGNAAVEEALYLTRFASKVHIVHRREELRAEKMYQERAKSNPKINFVLNSVVTAINGNEKVDSVMLKDVTTGEITEIQAQGIFPYIGYTPNSEMFKHQLKLDNAGFIITDMHLSTDCEGVFAAGDIRVTPLRQIVVSVADGAIAATSAANYLREKEFSSVGG